MTTERAPLISICIPTYKGAEYLGAAIESVLTQSCGDFELIVADDNSPDHTEALVRSYADPRIVYLRNERNLGPQGNWNRCVAAARGRYVKLLPHDDLLLPGCLTRQLALLEQDVEQRLALVFSAREVIGPGGRRLARRGYPGLSSASITAGDLIAACVRRGTNLIGEPGAVMFRRELMRRVGEFDAAYPYVIDLDYWVRLLAHGDAYFIDEPLAAFRVSPISWSVAIGSAQSREFNAFVAARCADQASALDRLIGRAMARFNNVLRLLFYRLYLR
jgi:glycosyltransferase involved in cell wall biosynthesis